MKIGLIRRGYSPTGGAEAYLLRLARGLVSEGHVPVLIGSPEWPAERWPNEFVVRVEGRSPVQFARNARRAVDGCDLIFSLERVFECDIYRAGDGVHKAWIERRAAFEPAWRRWTRWMNPKHSELLRLEACVYDPAKTRLVIANSGMVRAEIVGHYGYPKDRIVVVPNGVDAAVPPAGARESKRGELGLSADEIVLLFAGSGWERKGLKFAVEAMRRFPEATLVVAGRGDSRGLEGGRIRFLGPVADMPAWYAAADVFVLPTIYDPFSNACLEALAAGLPVITTNANGFSEIIAEGIHGSAVVPGDVEGIGRAIAYWSDPGRRQAARSACADLAKHYTVAENTRRTLEAIA